MRNAVPLLVNVDLQAVRDAEAELFPQDGLRVFDETGANGIVLCRPADHVSLDFRMRLPIRPSRRPNALARGAHSTCESAVAATGADPIAALPVSAISLPSHRSVPGAANHCERTHACASGFAWLAWARSVRTDSRTEPARPLPDALRLESRAVRRGPSIDPTPPSGSSDWLAGHRDGKSAARSVRDRTSDGPVAVPAPLRRRRVGSARLS